MHLNRWILFSFSLMSSVLVIGAERPCRSIEFARIDTQAQLARLSDVCEIRESLAIFTADLKEITLPRLKKVGLVNVEANNLEAIAFPFLETARDIYLTGSDLKVAEFPRLQTVAGRLVIQEKNLQFLHFAELRRAGRLILYNCSQLEFVFADKLYDVASLRVENTPNLNPASAENLRKVTRIVSPEEKEFIRKSQEEMLAFKRRLAENNLNQPPIRPTGHPTHFDSFGMIRSYYEWYPYEYSRYWDVIGPYHYTFFYSGFPFFFFPH